MTSQPKPMPKRGAAPSLAFQPGDRVRVIHEGWGPEIAPLGSVGTVIQPSPLLAVAFDHDPEGDGIGMWAMTDRDIEHLGRSRKARARLRRRRGEPALFLHALADRRPGGALSTRRDR